MTHAAFFPLVLVCSLAAPGALRAQPADVAALALYEGADREQRLVTGARTARAINLYSSLVLAAFQRPHARGDQAAPRMGRDAPQHVRPRLQHEPGEEGRAAEVLRGLPASEVEREAGNRGRGRRLVRDGGEGNRRGQGPAAF